MVSPCDIHHRCRSGFIHNMITYTRRENAHAHPHITKKLGSDLSVLDSTRSLDGLRDTVAPCSRIPAGSLVARSSSSVFALQVNGRGGGGSRCDEQEGVQERQ